MKYTGDLVIKIIVLKQSGRRYCFSTIQS